VRELEELAEVEQVGRLQRRTQASDVLSVLARSRGLATPGARARTQSSSPRWIRFCSSVIRFSVTSLNARPSPASATDATLSAERLLGRPRPIPLGPYLGGPADDAKPAPCLWESPPVMAGGGRYFGTRSAGWPRTCWRCASLVVSSARRQGGLRGVGRLVAERADAGQATAGNAPSTTLRRSR
jgi:hypothetical protein